MQFIQDALHYHRLKERREGEGREERNREGEEEGREEGREGRKGRKDKRRKGGREGEGREGGRKKKYLNAIHVYSNDILLAILYYCL